MKKKIKTPPCPSHEEEMWDGEASLWFNTDASCLLQRRRGGALCVNGPVPIINALIDRWNSSLCPGVAHTSWSNKSKYHPLTKTLESLSLGSGGSSPALCSLIRTFCLVATFSTFIQWFYCRLIRSRFFCLTCFRIKINRSAGILHKTLVLWEQRLWGV